jgi:hypothetical protein
MRLASRKLLQVALTTLAATTLAHATDLVKPNIKPGLWEVTTTPQMTGQMPFSEADLAKMKPEQRARMEAAIKSQMAKPRVHKDCMTPEKIAKGFDIDRKEDASCKRKVVSSSPNELTLHDECNRESQKTVSDVHFEVKGGTQMSGKVNIVSTSSSGKTFTVNATVQGKWLSSSCGDVKDTD